MSLYDDDDDDDVCVCVCVLFLSPSPARACEHPREAEVLVRLRNHAHVISFLGVARDGNRLSLVMELMTRFVFWLLAPDCWMCLT